MQAKSNSGDFLEIDTLQLLRALWRRIWAIILAALIAGGAAFAYGNFMVTPMYQASTLLYVNSNSISLGSTSLSISAGELNSARTLVSTYLVILKTRLTLEPVIKEAGVDYSYETLSGMVSAAAVNNTEVFRVTVTSANPEEAKLLANTIAKVLPERISEIVAGTSARVVDFAVTPSHKVSPNITKITLIGVLVGALLCAGIIVVITLLDDLVHDEDLLRQLYDLPVLAAIPDLMTSKSNGYGYSSGYDYDSGYGYDKSHASSQEKSEAK